MTIAKRKTEDRALLNPLEIDGDDDGDNDDYSECSTSEEYEEDDSGYCICRWSASRSRMAFCVVLIALAMGYSFLGHTNAADNKDFFLPNLPYEWKSDGPHDVCDPGTYFDQILEETRSRTEPECPQLCTNPSEVRKLRRIALTLGTFLCVLTCVFNILLSFDILFYVM